MPRKNCKRGLLLPMVYRYGVVELCPDFNYTNVGEGKSFADDLNKELGIVSCRVTLLLRSTEIKPSWF